METIKDILLFLKERKLYWIAPTVIVLGILGVLLVFTEGSAASTFIYSLF